MESFIEITVSKDGKFIFSTSPRSCPETSTKWTDLYALFREKFPESEGYKIIVIDWHCSGQHIIN